MFNEKKLVAVNSLENYFFYIDSNNLDVQHSRLYGYTYVSDKKLSSYLTDKMAYSYINEGAFVLLQCFNSEIFITQDHVGSYGLYLYRNDDFFALSNSLIYLIQKLNGKYNLNLNYDYIGHLLLVDLTPLSYSETVIKEISILPRDCRVIINKKDKSFLIEYLNSQAYSIDLDSKEGIDLLDKWYFKWVSIIRHQIDTNKKISVDLSGGFDSRIVFSLFANDSVDLENVNINSDNRLIHTFKEDFKIATDIANFFNCKLNSNLNDIERTELVLDNKINFSLYSKIFFHKEFQYQNYIFNRTVYSYGGLGGESIRSHWNMDVDSFVKKYKEKQESIGLAEHFHNSFTKILKKSLREIKQKYNYNYNDEFLVGKLLYRETRMRYHFGRDMVLNLFSNKIRLAPILDPMLQKIKIPNNDYDLLMALIFVRFSPDLLNFKFDSGRRISEKILEKAKSINDKFLKNTKKIDNLYDNLNIIIQDNFGRIEYENNINKFLHIFDNRPDRMMKEIFLLDGIKSYFDKSIYKEFYYYANDYANIKSHQPLSEVNTAISLHIIDNMINNNSFDYPSIYDFLVSLFEKSILNINIKNTGVYINENMDFYYRLISQDIGLNRLLHLLSTIRIDIKNLNSSIVNSNFTIDKCSVDGTLNISDNPKWFSDGYGIGRIIQSRGSSINLILTAKNSGKLEIKIRAMDKKFNNKQIDQFVDVIFFNVNGESVLKSHRESVSHDKPLKYFINVERNQSVNVFLQWKIYNYTRQELVQILEKL